MSADLGTVASPWTLDGDGYLLTPAGFRAARIDTYGTIWLWDKRDKCEVPLTTADVASYAQRMESLGGGARVAEPHNQAA